MLSDLVDVTVVVEHETDKAWLVNDGGKTKVWVPKSKGEIERNRDGRTWTLTMPQWLAEDKGFV